MNHIASGVAFLATPEGGRITGQVIEAAAAYIFGISAPILDAAFSWARACQKHWEDEIGLGTCCERFISRL